MYNPYQQNLGFNPQQTGAQGNYNQQQQNQQQQPQQQQQQNYYLQPLNNQATGYYLQPQFQQQLLYPSQQFQPQLNTQIQPQQTGYIQTQPTGFQQPGGGPIPTVVENVDLKIPPIRLSFITAEDQKKFEHLFRTAVPKGESTISGESASNVLLRSGLQPVTLAEIWSLSDFNKSGSLLFPEFALALHLCSVAKRGEHLPGILPERWLNEVKSFIDAISFSVPEDPSKILANTPFATFAPQTPAESDWLQPQGTGYTPQYQNTFQPQQTGFNQPQLVNQKTGPLSGFSSTGFGAAPLNSQRTGGGSLIPLKPQQTASLIPAQKTGSLQPQSTGFGQIQQPPQLQQQTTGYQSQIPTQRTGGFNQLQQQAIPAQRTGGFVPLQQQSTGYVGQLQNQSTGYPGQIQNQSTGYGGQLQSQQTGTFSQQPTGALQPQPTGRPGEWGFVSMPTGGIPGLGAMQEHFLPNATNSSNSLQNAMGGSQSSNVTDKITKQEKLIYDGIFGAWDTSRKGYIEGDVALGIFTKSGLGRPDLESIWNLADTSDRGKLNIDEFAVAMHLVYRRLNGYELPIRLPPELIPPSNKYLQDSIDSLKDSLRAGKVTSQTSNAPKQTKQDGRRFKNDDSNFGYLSNSRHKSRDNISGSTDAGSKGSSLSAADLKKLINEKKILLAAIDTEDGDLELKKAENKINDEISILKSKISELEKLIVKSSNGSNGVESKLELSDKLKQYTQVQVPTLIKKIHSVNQDIAKAKIGLFKRQLLKENPDWTPGNADSDIVGTGPNGEITESDRRKHKSKQLLKQRMEALTGKSSNSGSNKDLDSKLRQETEKSNAEGKAQSEMIDDIGLSIKELEDDCAIHLQVPHKDEANYKKWEKGQDVSPDIAAFLSELSSLRGSNQPKISPKPDSSSIGKLKDVPQVSQQTSRAPAYTTPVERSAYIKAQAEKKMNERLEKLGISRGKTTSSGFNFHKSTTPTKDAGVRESEKAPEKVPEKVQDKLQKQTSNVEKISAPNKPEIPAQSPTPQNVTVVESSDDDNEDDPEYAALLKRKQEIEAKDRERKLKKQQQREERLAKLKKEMDALENNNSSDEDDIPAAQVVTNTKKTTTSFEPTPQAIEIKPVEPAQKSEPVTNSAQEKKGYNPFAKLGNDNSKSAQSSFFKPASSAKPVDPQKAAAQRASQRGLSADNDWSDEEANSSDDDIPNRAGASQLASLLFGSMAPGVSKTPEVQTPRKGNSESDLLDSFNGQEKGEYSILTLAHGATEDSVGASQKSAHQTQDISTPGKSAQIENESLSDDEWGTPPPEKYENDDNEFQFQESDSQYTMLSPPPLPNQPPPIPQELPPSLNADESTEFSAGPPPPPPAPPSNGFDFGAAPPPPPPPSNGFDFGAAPPPPPPAASGFNFGAPAPPPPPPPPSGFGAPSSELQTAAPAVVPNINALLGQITGGKSLKKVDKSEQRIADGATVGKVL